ncbi:hypothetical protein MRB53_014797 [Persea americana]|uniref:Uncharacterized protein n=1 Tax=Persea americana TaxID=3435 RepID=A0ACC2KBY7_PERAE|nr:hypothetical protein MRB53_014797 [Persea americana]
MSFEQFCFSLLLGYGFFFNFFTLIFIIFFIALLLPPIASIHTPSSPKLLPHILPLIFFPGAARLLSFRPLTWIFLGFLF